VYVRMLVGFLTNTMIYSSLNLAYAVSIVISL